MGHMPIVWLRSIPGIRIEILLVLKRFNIYKKKLQPFEPKLCQIIRQII